MSQSASWFNSLQFYLNSTFNDVWTLPEKQNAGLLGIIRNKQVANFSPNEKTNGDGGEEKCPETTQEFKSKGNLIFIISLL